VIAMRLRIQGVTPLSPSAPHASTFHTRASSDASRE
jgi:hypothetical protein